jgi:hypothetical protein
MYCILQYFLGGDDPDGSQIPSLPVGAAAGGKHNLPGSQTLSDGCIGING